MKLSPGSVAELDQLLQTALIAGLKKIIVEPNKMRGVDEKQSVVLLTNRSIDLDNHNLAITRIDQLAARINLVKSQGGLDIDASPSTTTVNGVPDISQLSMSCGRTKAEYRCAAVETTKGVPKNSTDVMHWEIELTTTLLPTLISGVAAMSAEALMIASVDGKSYSFQCVDVHHDVFKTDVDLAPIKLNAAASDTFSFKYPAKTVFSLAKEALKSSPTIKIQLGEKGMFSIKVNGLDFFVVPIV